MYIAARSLMVLMSHKSIITSWFLDRFWWNKDQNEGNLIRTVIFNWSKTYLGNKLVTYSMLFKVYITFWILIYEFNTFVISNGYCFVSWKLVSIHDKKRYFCSIFILILVNIMGHMCHLAAYHFQLHFAVSTIII